jgi:hypothetical protein
MAISYIYRTSIVLCLFLVIASTASCVEGPPAFVRGIRIVTLYDVVDRPPPVNIMLIGPPPNAVIVKGIQTFGNSEGAPFGPASPGSGGDFDFDNESDRFGISDNPTIRDNMEWSIHVNYFFVIPGCGSATRSFGIPPGGTSLYSVCYLST